MRRIEKSYTPEWVKRNKGVIWYVVCSCLFWSSYLGWENRVMLVDKFFPIEIREEDNSYGPFSDALIQKKDNPKTKITVACPNKKTYY